ncbi:hypothetical protein AURANDRAFT_68253 [Aureococcus anophagefferens]|uniref:Uncharacterized protein n=1 Tax=Aureococcus anophagefferens TaxID=44056 RepID=F0YP04_AURAN|nr:hypothetical protein AURANDRAFT_68253 [Aureococcus anophagefferens]EGB03156.1 hypothetical protein AURANDRAFT_68253 [Aureococcus anophagefferens]|eukprot:XP_009042149.1 hypothetical protein AURANDRAFT_68253 [Aureococcus anophagefferens]
MTMNRAACYLGLDLGATNAKAALVDDDGRVVRYASLALGPGAARLAPERVAAALASCAATAVAGDWRAVAGCGVGSPGLVAGGAVAGAANLFRGEAAPVPLRALVAAELRRAAGRRVACDLVNERAEARVAAAYADARAAGAEGARGARASCAEVFARAAAGDAAAAAVVDDAAAHVALGCLNLARVLDCDVVVRALGWTVLPSLDGRVALAAAGPHAGCIGAAAVARGAAAAARRRRRRAGAAALAALAAAAAAAVALRRQKSIRMLFPGGLR